MASNFSHEIALEIAKQSVSPRPRGTEWDDYVFEFFQVYAEAFIIVDQNWHGVLQQAKTDKKQLLPE